MEIRFACFTPKASPSDFGGLRATDILLPDRFEASTMVLCICTADVDETCLACCFETASQSALCPFARELLHYALLAVRVHPLTQL